MSMKQFVILGLLAGLLTGCSQPTMPDADTQAEPDYASGNGNGDGNGNDSTAATDPMDDRGMNDGEYFDDEEPLTMVIYFDFDQSNIRPEYTDVLAQHATSLADNSRTSMRLEGHADEQGSREYNIGLGERRSQAVRRILMIQGGSSDQISTVSFGEERPVAFGNNEEAYRQNRRVEIKYTN